MLKSISNKGVADHQQKLKMQHLRDEVWSLVYAHKLSFIFVIYKGEFLQDHLYTQNIFIFAFKLSYKSLHEIWLFVGW